MKRKVKLPFASVSKKQECGFSNGVKSRLRDRWVSVFLPLFTRISWENQFNGDYSH